MRQREMRERLIDAAAVEFGHAGIGATGVDAVVRRAGVAKRSLYRHFPSKDDLVVAWLEHASAHWRAWLEARIVELARTPEGRLLAIFDALTAWFEQADFRGCNFANASAEYPDLAHEVRLACRAHKTAVRAIVRKLLVEARKPRPTRLSGELTLLIDGAITAALVEDDRTAARIAKRIAVGLLS